MGLFAKKRAPNPPTRAQLVDDFCTKLSNIVDDGFASGLDVYDIVRALNTRVEIVRARFVNSAPLGAAIP